MALIKLKARETTSVERVSEGADVYLKGLRDGTLTVASWLAALALEGRMFTASFGTVSTPITFTAAATIDITKPAALILVPSGIKIIPVRIEVYMEVYGASGQFECNAVLGTGGSLTSGGTAVTPVATVRGSAYGASKVSAYTGNNSIVAVGSTANLDEFWRDGQQFAITKTAGSATAAASDPLKFVWRMKDADELHAGVGAAELAVHQGSNAGQGFVKVVYVELPA